MATCKYTCQGNTRLQVNDFEQLLELVYFIYIHYFKRAIHLALKASLSYSPVYVIYNTIQNMNQTKKKEKKTKRFTYFLNIRIHVYTMGCELLALN